ncbi:YdcF family protein [Nocardia sp. NPDC049149]|uniref:YdcF family protein n=1 Tax=Nocardia sp. NPDC049149 TaxID=3364315 RepID=UPI00371ECADC
MSHNRNQHRLRTGSGITRRSALTAGIAACIVGAALGAAVPVANAGSQTTYVVLGAGVTPQGAPGPMAVFRLKAVSEEWQRAAKANNQNPGSLIIVTGANQNPSGVTEARAMRNWLVTHHISGGQIVEESTAGDTKQNAQRTAEILRNRGMIPAVVLVTSGCHMARATSLFESAGVTVVRGVKAPGDTSC